MSCLAACVLWRMHNERNASEMLHRKIASVILSPSCQLLKEYIPAKPGMRAVRQRAIEAARRAQRWGVVLGTLGRQGNPAVLATLERHLREKEVPYTLILMSEVSPPRLAMFPDLDAFVQIACPRLSIDWGEVFSRPTLTPYEALVALDVVPGWWEGAGLQHGQQLGISIDTDAGNAGRAIAPYPMDYYAKDGGEWSSSYHKK
ncbi:hypothetical protein Vafri_19153 [Volvox africanus]|uniref:2-(3-amino-3-carboxypropyl)histidine synthase subunit 1 n=1 Tax=Volvox africanus TaxID=51714 RepID=A0A8J4BQS8_9CHLO|nr:hypothetical protein Vafri_19153 [Volvox africanus]